MDVVQLDNVKSFNQFDQNKRLEGWSNEDFFDFYSNHKNFFGYFRCVIYLGRSQIFDERTKEMFRQLHLSAQGELQAIASHSLIMFFNAIEANLNGFDKFDSPDKVLIALDELISKIKLIKLRDIFSLEVEYYLLLSATYVCEIVGNYEDAIKYVAFLDNVTSIIDDDFLCSISSALYSRILISSGRYLEAIKTERKKLKDPQQKIRDHACLNVLSILFYLGDYGAAISIIEGMETQDSHTEHEVEFFKSFYGVLYGYDSIFYARGQIEHSGRYTESIKILEIICSFDSCAKVEFNSEDAINQIAKSGFQLWNTDKIMYTWFLSKCYATVGNYGISLRQLSRREELPSEELANRNLIAAQKLELFLQVGNYQAEPIASLEQEVRDIYTLARSFSINAPIGLSHMMQRWHPKAAAYAALMPDAPPELRTALEAVLRCGDRTTAYGITLPPTFVLECILKDFNLMKGINAAPLNKAMLEQKNQLKKQIGESTIWRYPVSGLILAYGFIKAHRETGKVEYQKLAEQILLEFGMYPRVRSEYAAGQIEFLRQNFDKLRQNFLTVEGFNHEILYY